MMHWFLRLEPIGPDVEMTVTGGMNRPPYQKDAGIAEVVRQGTGDLSRDRQGAFAATCR